VITPETSPPTSRTGVDDASTVTTSFTSPGCNNKSSENSSATRSVTPVRLATLNPGNSAETVYRPTGSSGMK
jgi:hypothetical protein